MYKLKRIKINNIGPIESIQHSFGNRVSLLIGENLTDESQISNGSGKTFLIESVVLGITGNTLRNINSSEIIREGQEEGSVEIALENNEKGRLLEIVRSLHIKKSSIVNVFVNGKIQSQIPSINEANKFILDEIGISVNDLLNYYIINKEKYTSFYSSSDTAKKDLITRFSKANIVDFVFDRIDKDLELAKEEELLVEKEIIKINSAIETLKSSEEEFPSKLEFDENKSNRVRTKKQQCEELFASIVEKEEEIKKIEKELKSISKLIEELPDSKDLKDKIKKEETTLKGLEEQNEEFRKFKNELQEVIDLIDRNLKGKVECPKCHHNFSITDPDFDISKADKQKKETIEALNDVLSGSKMINEEVQKNRKLISEINNSIIQIERKRAELTREVQNKTQTKTLLNQQIKFNTNKIEELGQEIEKILSEEYIKPNNQKEIAKRQKSLKDLNFQLDRIKEQIQFYKNWMEYFKSFKNYLANKSLENITIYTNMYLSKMKSSLSVQFDGFKELKSGKVREKIDVKINKFGEDTGSFGKLSSGEKARIEICTILAIQNLVNQSSGVGLQDVFIDEILESLDTAGLHSVLKALKELEQPVMLVTHGKVETNEFETVKICKENGVAKLI